jgi:hypothetical protein
MRRPRAFPPRRVSHPVKPDLTRVDTIYDDLDERLPSALNQIHRVTKHLE